MPTALHPQAKFDPIPPDLDLHAIVDRNPNFDWVVRINLAQIRRLGASGFEKLVQLHVIEGGRPLVIEGWNKVLPESLFSAKWLEKTHDKKQESVRDIGSQSDIPMTTGHYLRSMRQLTNQWSPTNFRDERRQRLYMKDIDCPQEWFDHLRKVIPPNVFYMNDNVSDTADTREDDIFGAPEVSAAVAGDLMSSLPEEMRAQNLMCYIGHEGTYTPAHREMCASLGQNIMVDASGNENGEKPGSSIWFMTETKDREVVREYFLSMLGHDIEIEKHFAQINAWKKASFPVYIVEQKVGDFILVPPLAPHQVWNRGTRTMKVAWNRTTVETLDLALHEALPKARLVCRDEQYKNKAIIYFTLEKYYKEMQTLEDTSSVGVLGLGRELSQNSPRLRQMADDFRRLFGLFTGILIDEMFGPKHIDVEYIEFDSNITCSYCRSNIFNRFLTCKCCVRQLVNGDEDTYDICMECYAMGRSCVCISGLQWCEQWHWSDLVEKHELWRSMVIKQDGFVDIENSPQPLEIARRKSNKKSVAQVCQEQLRRRPWSDITKPANEPAPEVESEPEPEVDEEGRIKKKPKSKRKQKRGDVYRCHVCCHKDHTYKLNFCTTCQEAYCYGVLWRAFDTMPQSAMEKEHWQCPKCLGICNCGSCRRAGHTQPYVPKNTLLGHDTRRIADDRSVESIVDFRIHNLNWLKAFGEESRSKDSKRMQRLREQADAEKAKGPLAALESNEDAPHEIEGHTMENAYGDQVGVDGAPAVQNGNSSNQDETAGSRVPTADMSGMDLETSAYPDPSGYNDPGVGPRMMGMGFYDQGDSADKILFDPFQIPSEDTLSREPEVSDFVKKTLRLAKRKARLETDDDPDFMGPKTWRKKPRTGNLDQLMNLDPALLGALGEPGRSGSGTPNRARTVSEQAPTVPEGEASNTQERPKAKPARAPLPIDPLRPTLRHAKPAQSYTDHEEPEEDLDDIVIPKRLLNPDAENGDTVGSDPVDVAAQAFRAVAGLNQEAAPPYTGKRRGRPPRGSLPANSPQTTAKEPAKEAAKEPAKEPKRRGRPTRRSQLNSVDYAEDSTPAQDSVNEDEVTVEALAADLEAEEAELAREPEAVEKPNEVEKESTPSARPPGRRGRPPKSAAKPAASPAPEPSPQPKFMSMAERMAAKGRGFKMRGSSRNITSNRTSTPSTPQSASARGTKDQDTPMKDADASLSRASSLRKTEEPQSAKSRESSTRPPPATSSAAPAKPVTRPGPTIVRLASMAGSDSEETDSSFGDDDDEDIPAKKFVAYRGGMRGRGRGGRLSTSSRR